MNKLVAGGLKAQAPTGPHPDPELLSAFAENALSEAERGQLLQHLGACSDCREILYLALPDSPEVQKVLVAQLRPFTFRRWIFGWGALAASVAVAAVFFTTNRLGHRDQPAPMAAIAPATTNASTAAANEPAVANETKIAADKAPQELDRLQAVRDAVKPDSAKPRMAIDMEKSESKAQPEAKHMTAKPQASLDFDESGQVRVSAPKTPAPTSSDQISEMKSADSRVQNLPVEGRNVEAPVASTAANPPPAVPPQPIGGMIAGKNAVGYASSRPDLLVKKSAPKSNLGGTILDSSGAVIANAKVTVVGPSGERSATSDPTGKFSFNPLPPGSYSLKAEASGFKATEIKQVAVLEDKPAALNVRLEAGTASQLVEVTGAAPVVAEMRARSVDTTGASSGHVARQTSQDFGVVRIEAPNSRLKDGMVASGTGSPALQPVLQWTISPEGAIQRSGDSGKTWQVVSVPGGVDFRALSAVGADIWAGGKAGALYHSADSGQNWVKVEPATSGKKLDQDIVRVDFPNGLNGTVSTFNGEVWTTADGGKTWLRK